MKGGLYCVYYSKSGAKGYSAQVNEVLTADELHRRLGHVSHERARILVKKGLVEGVEMMRQPFASLVKVLREKGSR